MRTTAGGGWYGFSDAVLGLLTLGACFIAIQRIHVGHARLEAEGDPDPLPAVYDDTTQAQAGLFLGWGAAALGWGFPALLLILLGPAAALAPWRVLGTTALIYGRSTSVCWKLLAFIRKIYKRIQLGTCSST